MNKIVQMIFRTFHFLKVKIINNSFTHIINVSKLAAETCVMKLIIIIIIFQLNKILNLAVRYYLPSGPI